MTLKLSEEQFAKLKAKLNIVDKPARKKPQQIESGIQQAFIKWVRQAAKLDSRLKYLFSVPNGGKRGYKTAKTMKAEGQLAGVCDILFPLVNSQYNGLAIEFKRPDGGVVSPEQEDYMQFLKDQRWLVVIFTSTQAAIDQVQEYLTIKTG